MNDRILILARAAIIGALLLVVGCVSDSPLLGPGRQTSQFDPSTVPLMANDRVEAEIREKAINKVAIIAVTYENEDYRACAEEAVQAFSGLLRRASWIDLRSVNELLTEDELSRLNTVFFNEPQLVRLSSERGFDGLVMIEVADLKLESTGVRIDTPGSAGGRQDYARRGVVTLRIKILDTFNMATLYSGSIRGESQTDSTSRNTKRDVLVSATEEIVSEIRGKVAHLFKPKPYVIEVRGDGKYVKVNIGSNSGIAKGSTLEIFGFLAIKEPSGRIISTEMQRITTIPVILVERDYCWCDATLSQGMIQIGHTAVP